MYNAGANIVTINSYEERDAQRIVFSNSLYTFYIIFNISEYFENYFYQEIIMQYKFLNINAQKRWFQ